MAEDVRSIVIKPQEFSADLLLPESSDEGAKLLSEPSVGIPELILGMVDAGGKNLIVRGGRIAVAALRGRRVQQVNREIKELREKGKIPDDYADENKYKFGFQSWVELMGVLDGGPPDTDRLGALQAMFYGVNKVGIEDAERNLNYWLFQIAKVLTSSELMLLKAMFECKMEKHQIPHADWSNHMGGHLKHNVLTLLRRDLRKLEDHSLAVSSSPADSRQSWVEPGGVTLTDLGIQFCENIKTYQLETGTE